MAQLLAPVKQEPDLTNSPERHSDRTSLQGAELRSLSIVSWASESQRVDDDESDTEMSYHADGEHVHPMRKLNLLSQVPPTTSGAHVGYSSSEEAYSKKLFVQSEARRNATLRSRDTEECKPLAVKREDQQISDRMSHGDHPSPSLSGSPYATRESSYSRSSTPLSTLSATPRNAARHANSSPSRHLRLRYRKLAAPFPTLRTSESWSKAAIFGTSRRHKPTSELIDDKRRVFVKQEIECEVEVQDFYDAPANPRGSLSRGSSPTTTSRASSEEDDLSGLGKEFYLSLKTLHNVAELAAVSAGVDSKRRMRPKPIDLGRAKGVYEQLGLIESIAGQLRQTLASHFPLLPPNNDSPANPTSTDPPEHQQEDTTSTSAQLELTLTPTDSSVALTSTSDLGWNFDAYQTIDSNPQGDAWNLPSSYTSYTSNGWDQSYLAQPLPTLTNPTEDAPMLPVQPLFPSIDPSPTFGTQNMLGTGSALYYNTAGPPYQIDPMLDNTVGLPLNTVMPPPPNNATFAPNLNAHGDDATGLNANTQLDPSWEELAQLLNCSPEELAQLLNSSPESTLPDTPIRNALPDNPSCSPSLAPNNNTSHPTNTAPAPPPAPETTSDADVTRIPCEVEGCGKTFRRPYLLKDHMRTHTGEGNAYPCTFEGCGKRFGSQSNLTRHYKTHQKRDKPAPSTAQAGNEDGRLVSPPRDSSGGQLTTQATPRRSRRLQNTALNPPGQRGYRILEPRTPATVNARAQKVLA
ncbi:hypothetical protein FS749_013943 [Ceratobasidium sp. UAMH 11750]|nr:hypothetical protein FS749_013943 [Ceratobasidium sp. UAMH 11750]